MKRCQWAEGDRWLSEYHDSIWGMPSRDDRFLFEMLVLSIFQAGLSWKQVWMKRAAFADAFRGYHLQKIAAFSDQELNLLLKNKAIIRNRAKLSAVIHNAGIALQLKKEFGTLSQALWTFAGGRPVINRWNDANELPTCSSESERFSAELKKRGMKFIGPVIAYAYMQSVGMVIDHYVYCRRYREIIDSIETNWERNDARPE